MVEALARYVKELGFCPKGDGELVSDPTCIAGSFIFQTSLFFFADTIYVISQSLHLLVFTLSHYINGRLAHCVMWKLVQRILHLDFRHIIAYVYTYGFEVLSSTKKEINCRMVYSFWQEYYFNCLFFFFLSKDLVFLSLVQIMIPNTGFIWIESSIYLRNYR